MTAFVVLCMSACGEVADEMVADTADSADTPETAEATSEETTVRDFGNLAPASLPVSEWVPTPFYVGLGSDAAIFEEGVCDELQIYRARNLNDFIGEQNEDQAPPERSLNEWTAIRGEILRGETVVLRCSPEAAATEPMMMAVGEDGFSLSTFNQEKGLDAPVYEFSHSTGALREVLPKFRKSLKSKLPVEAHEAADTVAEVGAYVSGVVISAFDGMDKDWYPPQVHANRPLGFWNYDWRNQRWNPTYGNASYFNAIHSASAIAKKSMRGRGTDCSPKIRQLLRDVFSKKSSDHCGHILAKRLGGTGTGIGPRSELNVFSQDAHVNQGSYNTFEGKIARYIDGTTGACCCDAYLYWNFHYWHVISHVAPGQGGRPDGVDYQVTAPWSMGYRCRAHFYSTFNTGLLTKVTFFRN